MKNIFNATIALLAIMLVTTSFVQANIIRKPLTVREILNSVPPAPSPAEICKKLSARNSALDESVNSVEKLIKEAETELANGGVDKLIFEEKIKALKVVANALEEQRKKVWEQFRASCNLDNSPKFASEEPALEGKID